MKHERLSMQFDPIIVKQTFVNDNANININTIHQTLDIITAIATAKDAPMGLRIQWELRANYKEEEVIKADATDLFTLTEIEDYNIHSGEKIGRASCRERV